MCAPSNSECRVSDPAGAEPSATRAEPKGFGANHHDPHSFSSRPEPNKLPLDETCFVSWVSSFLGSFWSARSSLGSFLRLSLCAPACTVVPDERSGDLWPVPMPSRARWTAHAQTTLGPHRRARVFKVAWELVRIQIGCLSWLALGCPCRPPARACVRGADLTDCQSGVIDTLERHCLHFLRAGRFCASQLGRSSEKFSALLNTVLELPSADVDRVLSEITSSLHAELDPYTRPRTQPASPSCTPPAAPSQDAAAAQVGACQFPIGNPAKSGLGPPLLGPIVNSNRNVLRAPLERHSGPKVGASPEFSGSLGVCSLGSGLSCKKIVADRIKWSLPPTFDPQPFLTDATTRRVYQDPSALKLPEDAWPRLPRAKVHCSRGELLRLASKWDSFKALRLVPCSEVSFHETVGCFGVPKDESFDRFILNPVVANSRTHGLSKFTKLLAPGCLLALAHLPSHEHIVRFCCDDLSEMYYTFLVTPARAQRNCLGMVFAPSEIQNFSVFNPKVHNVPCYLALATLAMGDCHAVEFAQQSHFNVLGSLGGCMRPHEFVAYRRPVPRTSCLEFLSIDDHLTAQICSRLQHKTSARLRDTIIFEGADRAYPAVGLVQHPKKRQRNVTKGTFLGADVDGVVGLISAPRHRVGVLMRITLLVVQRACASSGLLSSLLGLWVHVLLFRRPALAVLQSVFEDARRTPRTAVYRLQRSSLNELLALCALAPLLQADLRVDHPGMLFAMDASPSGAGLCAAELPPAVLKELWRHGEQKGFYTKLLEPAGALLAELDLHDDPGGFFAESVGDATVSGFAFGTEPLPLRPALAAPGCFVHLFARDPSWASAHCDLGLVPCPSPGLDLASLRLEDLASPTVFHQLRALLTSGAVFDLHVSAPVLSFASRGPFASRTPRSPSASHLCRGSLHSHDRLARRLCFLLCLAVSSGVFVSVTQPASSMLFRLHCFRGLISLGAMLTKVFCCAFWAPFKKPLLVLHNKPWLLPLNSSSNACGCSPGTVHFPVGGTFSQSSVEAFDRACCPSSSAVFGCTPRPGQSVSEFCAAYPRSFSYRAAAGSALAASGFVAPVPVSASSKALSQLGFSGLGPDPPRVEASEFEPRLFHDDPEWIGEVADCLDFREILRYKFRQAGHINILESRAYKTWIKWCSKRFPRSRLLGLIDSRVLLGAAAKGRSASPALCRVLRSTLPYVLGSGLYPCGLHVYSAKNRADGPSRGRPSSPACLARPEQRPPKNRRQPKPGQALAEQLRQQT